MGRCKRWGLTITSVVLLSALGVGSVAGPAWAKKAPLPTFTCTQLSGNINAAVGYTCGGNTGSFGISGSVNNAIVSIVWVNNTTTSYSFSKKAMKKEHGCPSTTYTEFKWHGTTNGDTTGSAPPGSKVKGKVCEDLTSGSIALPTGGLLQI